MLIHSMNANQILFFDTTLRDGEQSPGCTMHPAEKLRMAHQLAALGVDLIEAGFAIASTGDAESIRTIAREVRGPRIVSLARATRGDIEAAARSIEPAHRARIHTFLSTSDLHMAAKLKITREQALDQIAEMVAFARTFCDDIEFSPEDATRTDPSLPLSSVCEIAIEAGATTLNLPDTVGYCIPEDYAAMFHHGPRQAFPALKPSPSPHIAMTTSASLSPTTLAAHPSRRAARWSAPSTASANAPATPPSKNWQRS